MTTTVPREPVFRVQRSGERAFFDHDWLRTYHSFSFADYYDPQNLNWGALRVFNDDTIAAGGGFPAHPHRDMEILTYVLGGELEHRDSMGNRGVVGAGGVQFMSAGSGVRHSEVNHSSERELRLVQMWVVPRTAAIAPRYGQRDFGPQERLGRWLQVAGPALSSAPITIEQDAALYVARSDGRRLIHSFAPERYGFLFVAEGEAEANGTPLHAGDAVRMFANDRLAVEGEAELVFWDLPGA